MPTLGIRDREYLNRAFELAYLIIPDKGIALRVVEDAWCLLDLMLGKQARSRKVYKRLVGYLKSEERSRPLRTKIRLSHGQMLQWLVYAQVDSWERATEYSGSPYRLTLEDMIVRYIKNLVRITLNRNSFYVTLGITRLLYEYGPHEVRMMYDVLTLSDSARMKDIKYLRKQKASLMDEVLLRFNGRLETVTTPYREKRFRSQPTTERLIRLVNQCLYRFTPWDTGCAVQESFDPTAISGLYFSETKPADEDHIEMNRIHTMLHPDCFSRFVNGLSQFVKSLPHDSPDKSCNYDLPDKHLAVPQFHNVEGQDPRDDRFHPPELRPEDYRQLERSREALSRRRKGHTPRALRVYVDDTERASFDRGPVNRVQLEIEPEAGVIEVRGEDAQGMVVLASLIVCCDDIPSGGSFKDWVVLEGGQKVTIQVMPIKDTNGNIETARIEVIYAERNLIRALVCHARIAWLRLGEMVKPHREGKHDVGPDYSWLVKVGIVVALVVAAVTLIWFQLGKPDPELPPTVAESPQVPKIEPAPPPQPPQPSPGPQDRGKHARLIARATWSRDPESARQAVRLETVRGEVASVEVPRAQPRILIALPRADAESRIYVRYRATLLVTENPLWQQTLRAPRAGPTSYANVLSVFVSSQPSLEAELFVLRFEGETAEGWKPIGELTLRRVDR